MSKSYRHIITGLIGEFPDGVAEVFRDVLVEVPPLESDPIDVAEPDASPSEKVK